jgi:DNA repair protein RadC
MLKEIEKSKKWVPRYMEEERIRKEALKIGKKEGIKEGKKIGIEKGIEKGLIKAGKLVEKEKLKIAKKLKKKDVPVDVIASTTGLTVEEIKKL